MWRRRRAARESCASTSTKIRWAVRLRFCARFARITPEQFAIYPEYEASARRLARHFGVRPAEMLFSNGVDDALRLIMDTFVEPGNTGADSRADIFDVPFLRRDCRRARRSGALRRFAMRFPLEAILRALARSPRVLCLANPNNPTGTLLDRAALRRILDAAPRTLVLVDEAYFEFAGVTVLPWIRRRANLVVARTLSKAAGLAALRLGVLFARADIADALRRACTPYPVSNAALIAAEAALGDRDFLRRYVREVLASRRHLARGLERLGVRVFPSGGQFFARGFWSGRQPVGAPSGTRGAFCCATAPARLGRDGFVRVTAGTVRRRGDCCAPSRRKR